MTTKHNQRVDRGNARQLFKLKVRHSSEVCNIRHLCFTAADAAHTCNDSVLGIVEHREKDISVHGVGRHDSNACNLPMGTATDGWLVWKGTR